MGLSIRTIGIARAQIEIWLANLGYNIKRLIRLERTAAEPLRLTMPLQSPLKIPQLVAQRPERAKRAVQLHERIKDWNT